MDLCDDCLDFAIAISKRTKLWSRPQAFWNEARQRSDSCRLCKMISDYQCDNATENISTLGEQVNLYYHSFEESIGHRPPLSSVCFDTVSNVRVGINVWSDPGSLADLCGADCLQNHEECKYTISNDVVDEIHGQKLPTRVLDLGCADSTNLSLAESQGERGRYCALSYCWGPPGTNHLLTTQENFKSHLDCIKFDQLPRTLQDAVIVTRKIGVRYLWVDSLCIIQGDKADWTAESARMAEVYQNAYLVIAASGAAHPGEGCFSNKRRCSTSAEIPHFSEAGRIIGSIRLSMCIPGYHGPVFGPLQDRGWALQERMLARRTLYFMPSGMSWKCRELESGERYPYDMTQYPEWEMIVHTFSMCQLTYKEDRLVALEGLGMAYQEANGDRYTLGIFESQLPELLLWFLEESEVDTSEDLVSVPTWCWASKGGQKTFWGVFADLGRSLIDSAELTIETSGNLRMRGVLQECKISKTEIDELELANLHPDIRDLSQWRESFYLIETGPTVSGSSGIAIFDREHFETVNVLFLMELEDSDRCLPEQVVYSVLLLAPKADTTNRFRRIGTGFVSSDLDFGNHSSALQEVYII